MRKVSGATAIAVLSIGIMVGATTPAFAAAATTVVTSKYPTLAACRVAEGNYIESHWVIVKSCAWYYDGRDSSWNVTVRR